MYIKQCYKIQYAQYPACVQHCLQAGVESKATHSVRVPVKNLRAADPSLDVATLQGAFGNEFLRYARSKVINAVLVNCKFATNINL